MREPRELAAFCQAAGYIVRAVMHPTVPLGTERVRICLHAGNTKSEIDNFVNLVHKWLVQKLEANAEARQGTIDATSQCVVEAGTMLFPSANSVPLAKL